MARHHDPQGAPPTPAGRGSASAPLPAERRRPHPDRLDPARPDAAAIVAAHEAAMAEGRPGYLDPATGYYVMTAAALWGRGICCTNGCRHCPYVERAPGP